MNTGRKWIFRLLLVGVLMLAAIALDFIFGLFFQSYDTYLNKQQYGLETYTSNPRGYFEPMKFPGSDKTYYVIDRRNERNRTHLNTMFEPDSLKVLAIGDSFTFAQGVKLPDTYVKRLETLASAKKIYGINVAQVGADVRMVLGQLEDFYEKRPAVNPNVVVYGYVLNDPLVEQNNSEILGLDYNAESINEKFDSGVAYDFINTRVPVIKSLRTDFFKYLGEKSNILDFAISILEKADLSARTIQYYQEIHDIRKNKSGLIETANIIKRMNELTKAHKGRLLVVIFPLLYDTKGNYPFVSAHETLKKILTDQGIDVIDLLPSFSKFLAEDLWVHTIDQHPNEIAQGLVAKDIEYWLMKEQYIDLK